MPDGGHTFYSLINHSSMDENSFFSMDRLLEFGMGISIAQQMVNSMNHAVNNMHVPGAMQSMGNPPKHFFYAMIEGKQNGPFSEQEFTRLIEEKKVVKETYVWMPSLPNWKMAEQIPEVLKLVALSPPPFNK
jgi:hypothetical protein